jgi:Ca2+-binding RTX toxin-like protein
MLRRSRILVAIAAAFALALPSAASASSVHISVADELRFEAVAGENNDVEIDDDGAALTVTDAVGLTAGPGCLQVDATEAVCPMDQFDSIGVFLEDGENTVDSFQQDPIHIDGSDGSKNDITSFGWDTTTIVGGPGPDELQSGNGNDFLYGEGGDDELDDGWGVDVLRGGDGDDELSANLGSDDIQGGDGFDTVSYASRGDAQHLSIDNGANDGQGAEADNIHTDIERLESGAGDDQITGSDGPDDIEAGAGDDLVRGGAGEDSIDGESGDDDLRGEFDADLVNGGPGQDKINGGFSGDKVFGGTGNDEVNGSIGEDKISGGPDNDSLLGGSGSDELYGDAGDDNLQGQAGADILAGSIGTDTVEYSAYTSPITVDLDGSPFDDGIENEGDSVRADIENVTGGSGADKLTGNGNQNVLIGAQGDDTIDGGAESDTLIGASGADNLLSQDGLLDIVDCGTEVDTFTSDAIDTLTDCEPPAPKPGDGQPPVDPPVADPPVVAPAKLVIGPGAARVSRSRFVKLSVSCPKSASGPCTGTLRLQRSVKGKVRTLGRKGFKVPAGSKRTLKIKVSKTTAKSVARRPLKVNAAAKTTAGASDTSRKVTLKPAARRKR